MVQADVTLEHPSTTDGQKDVDSCSDEHVASRQEQCHHTELTPDVAAASWPDTAASMSTDHQLHDSTVGEQGDASTTVGRTNVDCDNVECDTSRQEHQRRTDPTLRLRVACDGVDTAA